MALTFLGRVLLDAPDSDLLHQVRESDCRGLALPLDSSETEQGLSLMAAGLADRDLAETVRDRAGFFRSLHLHRPPGGDLGIGLDRPGHCCSKSRRSPSAKPTRERARIAGADRMPGIISAWSWLLSAACSVAPPRRGAGKRTEARRLTEEVRVSSADTSATLPTTACRRSSAERHGLLPGCSQLCRATLGSLGALLEAAPTA